MIRSHKLENPADYRAITAKLLGKLHKGDNLWIEEAMGEHLELYRPFPIRVGGLGVGLVNNTTHFKASSNEIAAFISKHLELLIKEELTFQIAVFGAFNNEKSKWTIRYNKSLNIEIECLTPEKELCKNFLLENIKEYNLASEIIAESDGYYLKSNVGESITGQSSDFTGKNPHGLIMNEVSPLLVSQLPRWLSGSILDVNLGIHYDAQSPLEVKFPNEIYAKLAEDVKFDDWMTLFQLSRKAEIIRDYIYSQNAVCPVFSWRSKSYEDYRQVDLVHNDGNYKLIEYQGRVPYA